MIEMESKTIEERSSWRSSCCFPYDIVTNLALSWKTMKKEGIRRYQKTRQIVNFEVSLVIVPSPLKKK